MFFDDLDTPFIEVEDRTFTAGRVGIGSFDDMNEFTAVRIQGSKAAAVRQSAP